jgi:flagellum-specific ATP synthase
VKSVIEDIDRIPVVTRYGRVSSVQGLLVEVAGIQSEVSIGSRCVIETRRSVDVTAEVVGFRDDHALLMPFRELEGVGLGCRVIIGDAEPVVYPTRAWLGRVVNAFGEPIDGKGPIPRGVDSYALKASPPPAHNRHRVGEKIDLGVRAINTFMTCCRGQRMGIFSGSGIGKSVLLSMLSRYTQSDVNVIGLVGERGREVTEFIQDNLGEEGLKKSVVVVATSDESALARRQAAYLTLTLSEYFRDLDNDVLCLMDSVTRFAMAQREIGLSGGEPPASRGYTPTVFAELPKLLERAGPGEGQGTITGLFTVLVEGDDHNEPISDAVRAILDGHIIMDRSIAERGRFPPINILRSVSRTMPKCNAPDEAAQIAEARTLIATYEGMAEMIRLGAYRTGSDPAVDRAIQLYPLLEGYLAQDIEEPANFATAFAQLTDILGQAGAEEVAA